MSKQPIIEVDKTTSDKIVEYIGWFLLLAMWVYVFMYYSHLPDIIPSHYDAQGVPDGYSDRSTIFTMPIAATVIYISLIILNKYPHLFNYLTIITDKNAVQQYTYATRMIRYLNLIIVVLFFYIVYVTVQNALGEMTGMGTWFLPVFILVIVAPIFYYVIKTKQDKSK